MIIEIVYSVCFVSQQNWRGKLFQTQHNSVGRDGRSDLHVQRKRDLHRLPYIYSSVSVNEEPKGRGHKRIDIGFGRSVASELPPSYAQDPRVFVTARQRGTVGLQQSRGQHVSQSDTGTHRAVGGRVEKTVLASRRRLFRRLRFRVGRFQKR